MPHHPTNEELAAFVEKALPPADRDRVVEHIGACDTCLATVAAVRRAMSRKPAARRFRWWAAAAVWLIAIAAGFAIPVGQPSPVSSIALDQAPRTYVHIDFENARGFVLAEGQVCQVRVGDQTVNSAGAVRSDGWWIVSVKLPEPIVIQKECTMRVEVMTNAGYCLASIFPLGKDAALIRLDPISKDGSWTTITAHVDHAPKAGSELKPGDRVDRVTIGVPAQGREPPQLLVRAIDLKASR